MNNLHSKINVPKNHLSFEVGLILLLGSLFPSFSAIKTNGHIGASTTSIFVHDASSPTIDSLGVEIIGDSVICHGDLAMLSAIPTGGVAPYTYLWSPDGDTTSSISVFPELPGENQYTVTVTDSAEPPGMAEATAVVSTALPFNVTISGDPFICAGSPAVLTAMGSVPNLSFTWTNGSGDTMGTSQMVEIIEPGTYNLEVSDGICPPVTFSIVVNSCNPPEIVIASILDNGDATYSVTFNLSNTFEAEANGIIYSGAGPHTATIPCHQLLRITAPNICGFPFEDVFVEVAAPECLSPNLPSRSIYESDLELQDTTRWTNYFKMDESGEPDTVLFAIAKNGRVIGDVEDDEFEVIIDKDTTVTDITALIQAAPGFESIEMAMSLDYYWRVTPKFDDCVGPSDSLIGIQFFFSEGDIQYLETALGLDLPLDSIYFFKASSFTGEYICENLESIDPSQVDLQIFRFASQASETTWALSSTILALPVQELIGQMDIIGFSCGGLFAVKRQVNHVKKFTDTKTINIHPNPSPGIVQLDILSRSSEMIYIRIVNSLGQLVYREAYEVMAGKNAKQIQLDKFPHGIYNLILDSLTGESLTKKIILLD